MSLLLAGTVGVSRDLAAHREPITITPGDSTAGATAGFGQLVVAQIPGEALLAYTTLLALFSASSTGYQTGRWILYGLSLPACAAVVLSAYVAGHGALVTGSPAALHLPLLPMGTAVMAMGIYGLSVPGSPLQQSMSDTGFAITAGCLSVGGGIAMSVFAPFLGRGNSVVMTQTTPVRTPVAVAA